MSDDVYRRLAKHLASLGMGYPEKEELLEILGENFTPLAAEVALAIPGLVHRLRGVRHSLPCLGREASQKVRCHSSEGL